MRRFFSSPTVRGLALVAAFALVIVLLSLEAALLTASALLSVAFFLAIAFFLFLVWRERRSDIETWPDRSRRTFYAAIVLAVPGRGRAVRATAERRGRACVLRRARSLRLRARPGVARHAPILLGIPPGRLTGALSSSDGCEGAK